MIFIIKYTLKTLLVISQFSPLALLWMVKSFLIDWPMQKWSFYKLPYKAKDLGLRYIASDYIREFGIIKGPVQGYNVEIKAGDSMNASIRISSLLKEGNIKLSLNRSKLRPAKNINAFTTENRQLNVAFKTKRCHEQLLPKLTGNNALFDKAVMFYSQWIFSLDSLMIHDGEIYCTFRYGFYFFPYIPAGKIEPLIHQLIEIAKSHDALVRN